MKNLNLIVALLLALSPVLSYSQTKAVKAQKFVPAQQVPVSKSLQSPQEVDFVNTFNGINNIMNPCSILSLRESINARRNKIGSVNSFPELLSRMAVAKSFVEIDDRLLNCATSIIDSLTNLPSKTKVDTVLATVHDSIIKEVIVPDTKTISDMQQACNQKMIYLAVASGSIILVLLVLLYNIVHAHKIFKDLYDKIYDKVIDELADKLLVGIGIKEDDKFKDKIKKLVELNQRRKKGEIKLVEYFHKVDVILD